MNRNFANYTLSALIFFIANICPAPDEPPCSICSSPPLPGSGEAEVLQEVVQLPGSGGVVVRQLPILFDLRGMLIDNPIPAVFPRGADIFDLETLLGATDVAGDTLLPLDDYADMLLNANDYADMLLNAIDYEESYLAYQGLQSTLQEMGVSLNLPELPDDFDTEENYISWENYFLWVEYLGSGFSYIDHEEFVGLINGELGCNDIYYDACAFAGAAIGGFLYPPTPIVHYPIGESIYDLEGILNDAGENPRVSEDSIQVNDLPNADYGSLLDSINVGNYPNEYGYANDDLLWELPSTD